jgi:hypothetical protein
MGAAETAKAKAADNGSSKISALRWLKGCEPSLHIAAAWVTTTIVVALPPEFH